MVKGRVFGKGSCYCDKRQGEVPDRENEWHILLDLSEPQFPICKMGVTIKPTF